MQVNALKEPLPPAQGEPARPGSQGGQPDRLGLLGGILLLLLVTVLVRLPYFCHPVIDWDESTYILIGQSILDGHLPKTVLVDVKPPSACVPYAFFILLFGRSIAAVRLGGLACVFVASVCIYLTCRRRFGMLGALMAGISVIVFTTIDQCLGATMLEHIALVPLACVALIWPTGSLTPRRGFLIGLLVGLASALKTNLAGFLLAPLALTLFTLKGRRTKRALSVILLLILGCGLPMLSQLLAYALLGKLDLLWHTSIVGASRYASAHLAESSRLASLVPSLGQQFKYMNKAGFLLAWLVPFCGLLVALTGKGRYERKRSFVAVMAVFSLAGFLTIVAAGTLGQRHCYIVLVPFTAAISGYVFQFCLASRMWALASLSTCCALFLALQPVYSEYTYAWKTAVRKKGSDTAYKVADYLRSKQVKGQYVYFNCLHIGYWLLDARIPTRIAHPSGMWTRSAVQALSGPASTPTHELELLFQKRPLYVVTYLKQPQLPERLEFLSKLGAELQVNYVLEKQIDGVGIFRRR